MEFNRNQMQYDSQTLFPYSTFILSDGAVISEPLTGTVDKDTMKRIGLMG